MALDKFGVRALISIIFGPLIIFSAWIGGVFFFTLILLLTILGQHEFYQIAAKKENSPNKLIGLALGISINLLVYLKYVEFIWVVFAVFFLVLLTVELFRNTMSPILNISTTFAGAMYVTFFLDFLILIRAISPPFSQNNKYGAYLVILIFLAVWVCDSAAYILGSRFGKRKLFKRVSPNKTVLGTVFGFITAVLLAGGFRVLFFHEISVIHVLVIGAICGSFGQVSDLVESLFKRDAQVKDSSNIIPGHGGILDRFDSEILVAPVVYFYVNYIVF